VVFEHFVAASYREPLGGFIHINKKQLGYYQAEKQDL